MRNILPRILAVWTLLLLATTTALSAYTITTNASPSTGGGTLGGGTVNSGSIVTVWVVPFTGYTFVNWTEGGISVSTSSVYTFTATANRTLVANFAPPITYSITTTASPSAAGITSGGGTVNSGASTSVWVMPNAGYTFVNWTERGIPVSTSSVYTFTATANRTLVANFTPPITYNITTTASPSAGGGTLGGGTVNAGASVTVWAVLSAGYKFVNWTEGGVPVSTSLGYTFPAAKNRTLVANFALSNNADLASLVPNLGLISPVFASGTTSYTARVSYPTASFTLMPTVAAAGATLTINGTPVSSGANSGPISLSVGPNLITIIVTAPDRIATKTYTLTVTRSYALGDLNGDGASDLVFQNTATGQLQAWRLDGTGASINFATGSGIKSTVSFYGGSLVGWRLAGSADVNSDGIPDLLFQNTVTGQVYAWFLDGTGASINSATGSGIKSTGYLYGGSLVGWRLAAIADVNGDSISDLVFQNTATGQVYAWFLDGTGASINFATGSGIKSTGYLYGGSLVGWQLARIADVNGDGFADLVFQNTGPGQVYAWFLDGTGASINFATGSGIKSTGYLYGGSLLDWQLAGISDVNGDGIPDLLFQNTGTGSVYAWFLDGTGASINFVTGSGIKSTGYLYGGSLVGSQLR